MTATSRGPCAIPLPGGGAGRLLDLERPTRVNEDSLSFLA
jgi:hypothetical protein